MARALDEDELIFQLQLDEIRKVSNQEEINVLCDDFQNFLPTGQYQAPRVCDALGIVSDRGGRNNTNTTLTDIPRQQTNFYGLSKFNSFFNPERLESLGSSSEMDGGDFSDTGSRNFARRKATDGMRRNVNKNRYPRDSPVNTQFNRKNDKLVAQQLAMDDQIRLFEEDRVLAEKMQLKADLESAKELDKHNNQRRESRGADYQTQMLPWHGSNFQGIGLAYKNLMEMEERSDKLIAQQVQLAMDDQMHLLALGHIVAEEEQFKADMESAKELDKHNNQRRESRGADYHTQTLPWHGSNFQGIDVDGLEHEIGADYHTQTLPWHGSNFQGIDVDGLEHERGADYHTQTLPWYGSNFQGIDVDGLDYEDLLEMEESNGEATFRGLQQSEIATLPKETINQREETQCVICLEHLKLNDVIRKFACSHAFHIHCIDLWLKQNAVCPVCKVNIKDDNSKKR